MSTQPFNNFHLLTEAQYAGLTPDPKDIYAVLMPSITPGELVVKAFQGTMPTTLTAAQQAAAQEWFGIQLGVKITSSDPTIAQAEMVDGELLNCHVQTITVDGTAYKVLVVD